MVAERRQSSRSRDCVGPDLLRQTKLIIACKRSRVVSVPKLTVWNGISLQEWMAAFEQLTEEAGIRSSRPAAWISLTQRSSNLRHWWCKDGSRLTKEEYFSAMWRDSLQIFSRFICWVNPCSWSFARAVCNLLLARAFTVTEEAVLVWAALWHGDGLSPLYIVDGMMTGRKYRGKCLLPHVAPIVQLSICLPTRKCHNSPSPIEHTIFPWPTHMRSQAIHLPATILVLWMKLVRGTMEWDWPSSHNERCHFMPEEQKLVFLNEDFIFRKSTISCISVSRFVTQQIQCFSDVNYCFFLIK